MIQKYDYDAQIARLTEHPERIMNEWHRAEGLFQFCRKDGSDVPECGCLSMIRGDENFVAATPELTKRIKADERLPTTDELDDLTPEQMQAMKEWQEELDRTIRAEEQER